MNDHDPDALMRQPDFLRGMWFIFVVALFLIIGGVFMFVIPCVTVGKVCALIGIGLALRFAIKEIVNNWRRPPRFYC